MTLLDRIHQLKLEAVVADDEDKIKSRSGEFTSLRERLETATTSAVSVAAARDELQSAGIVQDDYEQKRSDALTVVEALIETIENLPLVTPFDTAKLHGSVLEAHFKDSAKLVSEAWSGHLPSTPPTGDEELLDALERGGIDVDAIRSDIEEAKLVLLRLENRTMPQPGDCANLQKALETLNSSGERIGKLIDPAIADIVVRAQDAGVPFSEMTSDVITKLSELGILDQFRVVLK